MKYAFMSFSCPDLSLDQMLAVAQKYGYAGIEPRIDARHAHGLGMDSTPQERRIAKEKAQEANVALCCVATSRRYADPANVEQNVSDTLRCIDLAADVGAPSIRVFGGRLGEGLSRGQAIDQVSGALEAVAERAEAQNVYVCMETHDDWCNPAHVAAVMKRVARPMIAVNWDVMHPVRREGWTVDQSYQELEPWVRHLHVHDGTSTADSIKYVPMGTGQIDTRRAIQLLQGAGYEGYLSGEWIRWEPYDVHLPREIKVMKSYEE